MLLRVSKNIQQFPAHIVPILTSVVIECQRAKLTTEAYEKACVLMRPEYRTQIAEQYKKKIENIVRKPLADDARDASEVTSACIYCGFQLPESQLDCVQCKNISPFCIASGMRMVREDWTYCLSCNFPAKRTAFLQVLQTQEVCPMCQEPCKASDLPVVPDPQAQITDYKALFQLSYDKT